MSAWKIATVGFAAVALIAVAHHARAQDAEAAAHSAPTEAQMAELHGQLTSLLTLVYQHTDFDAVETHLTTLISENPEAIGGDAAAFTAHVSQFLNQVQEHAASDPRGAAEFTANMMIEAHRPQ